MLDSAVVNLSQLYNTNLSEQPWVRWVGSGSGALCKQAMSDNVDSKQEWCVCWRGRWLVCPCVFLSERLPAVPICFTDVITAGQSPSKSRDFSPWPVCQLKMTGRKWSLWQWFERYVWVLVHSLLLVSLSLSLSLSLPISLHLSLLLSISIPPFSLSSCLPMFLKPDYKQSSEMKPPSLFSPERRLRGWDKNPSTKTTNAYKAFSLAPTSLCMNSSGSIVNAHSKYALNYWRCAASHEKRANINIPYCICKYEEAYDT